MIFFRPPRPSDDASEQAERVLRVKAFWDELEGGLLAYGTYRSIPVLIGLKFREGFYVSGASVALTALVWAAATMPPVPAILAAEVAAYYLLDSLLYNTRIIFVPRRPISSFRSVMLTINAYINMGLAFGVLYAVQTGVAVFDAIYFSFATMTTIGAKTLPTPAAYSLRPTILLQLLTSLYFLVVVVAAITARAPATDGRFDKSPRTD